MAHKTLDLANALLTAGELEEALDILNTHLTTQPDDDDARRLRAGILLRKPGDGQAERQQAALNDLDAIANPNAEDHLSRSLILEALGDLNGALAAAQNALQAEAGSTRLTERIVHLLIKAGDLAAAREIIKTAQTQSDDWRWSQWAGDLAAQADDQAAAAAHYQQALTTLDQVWQKAPDNVYVAGVRAHLLVVLGHLKRRARDYRQAQAHYDAAAATLQNDPVVKYYSGLTRALAGDQTGIAICRSAYEEANALLKAQIRTSLAEEANPALSEAVLQATS